MRARIPCLAATLAACATCGACGSEPGPTSAASEEIGELPRPASISGRDGGNSALLWGHSVWAYGDTVLTAEDEQGSTWHHNSFSITEDADASDGIEPFSERTDAVGAPRYFVAPTEEEAIFNGEHAGDDCQVKPCGARWAVWPGQMVFDAERDRALIFYGLIHAEPGDFNFRGVGSSIAVWERFEDEPTRPEVSPDAEHPTLLFGEGELPWGTAAVIDGADLFVFACDSDEDGFSPPCRLARVSLADALDRSAWRYWDGSGWSETMDDASVLFAGAPSVTVSFNAYLGSWTALYATPLSNEVVMRTAPELTGPWSEPGLMFIADRDPEGAYDANSHPELEEDEGRVQYVTFSRPNGDGWFGSDVALVRVELP